MSVETEADPKQDPIFKEELAALSRAFDAGEIAAREYNDRRRRALDEARARISGAEPAGPAPILVAPPEAAPAEAPAEAEAEASKQVAIPKAWAEQAAQEPKYWSERGRGDDPSVRQVLPPLATGIGTGKSFSFIFGLKKARDIDQMMLQRETQEIQDDIEVLRNAGYTVVVDPQGSKQDFLQVVYGEGEGVEGLVPAGVYWSAHGHDDGAIECCDASRVFPGDVETAKVSPGLKVMVFGACYTGSFARTWRTALGGHPLVVGWGRPVTIDRAVEFLRSNPDTDTDLDDLIARYLLQDTPVPPMLDDHARHEAACKAGRKDDLEARVPVVAELLSGKWRAGETWFDLWVPLPENRHHVVRLFVVDATLPYIEGRPLIGVEAEIGELTAVVQPDMLLRELADPGYARVVLAKGRADHPDILAQGFLPLARVTDLEIAAVAYQVARTADDLERKIFGGDR
jgi:hypothetical protein